MNYYYAMDGKPTGPVLLDALQALKTSGTINDTTLIIAEGESSWMAYGERFPPTPAAQRVAQMPTPAATPAATKEKISAVAYQSALAATSRNDEFNTSNAIEFPVVRYDFPLDLTTPKLCIASFIAIPGAPQVVLQMMIWNRSGHGLVHYNTVKASGGIELECKHVNSNAVHVASSPTEWQETISIFLPIALLLKGLKEPLRLQISRPNEGKAFVINVSVNSVAAVLYRLFPDRYEVDTSDLAAQRHQQAKSKAKSIASLIGSVFAISVWILTPVGFVASVVLGFIAGIAYYLSPLGTMSSTRVGGQST